MLTYAPGRTVTSAMRSTRVATPVDHAVIHYHTIAIADDTKPVGFIVHGRPPGGHPDTKDTPNDRFFTPVDHPEIWLKEGDATIYTEEPAP